MKGYVFTLEATLALLLLTGMLLAFSAQPAASGKDELERLYALQQSDDLLVYWFSQGNFDLEQMEEDFRTVFPEKSGVISVDGLKKTIGAPRTGILVREEVYWDGTSLHSVKVQVYLGGN